MLERNLGEPNHSRELDRFLPKITTSLVTVVFITRRSRGTTTDESVERRVRCTARHSRADRLGRTRKDDADVADVADVAGDTGGTPGTRERIRDDECGRSRTPEPSKRCTLLSRLRACAFSSRTTVSPGASVCVCARESERVCTLTREERHDDSQKISLGLSHALCMS